MKKIVRECADQTEVELKRGTWRDPRLPKYAVGGWAAGRSVEPETKRSDIASWELHLAAHFKDRPLELVTRTEVQAWVKDRMDAAVGPSAIRRALNLLRPIMESAVTDGLIQRNVARKVKPPPQYERLPDWYTTEEVDRIVGAMRADDRESDAVMTLPMWWAGPRWGEAAALSGTAVARLRGFVRIDRAMSQYRVETYPRTSSSIREIPFPRCVLDATAALMQGTEPDSLIFTTKRRSRPLSGANWRTMWAKILSAAGIDHGTPHMCRHTCASWLVQDGVPLYDVQRQLATRIFRRRCGTHIWLPTTMRRSPMRGRNAHQVHTGTMPRL